MEIKRESYNEIVSLIIGLFFMTAVIYSGTPTSIQNLAPIASLTTLERLIMWALMLYNRINKARDIPLIEGDSVKQSSFQRFEGKDGNLYLGFTVFLPIATDYEVIAGQPWTHAIEQNTASGGIGFNS